MSGGLTSAWLTTVPNAKGKINSSLRISVDEQVRFFKRWWKNEIPLSPRAIELTKKVTFLETSPRGLRLNGKTGSGYTPDLRRIGWFVSHLENESEEWIAVVSFTDLKPVKKSMRYAGLEARDMEKSFLKEMGKW